MLTNFKFVLLLLSFYHVFYDCLSIHLKFVFIYGVNWESHFMLFFIWKTSYPQTFFYGFPCFSLLFDSGWFLIFSAAWVLAPPAFQTSLFTTLYLCATSTLASFVVLEHTILSSSPKHLHLLFSLLGMFFFPHFLWLLPVIQAFPSHWR